MVKTSFVCLSVLVLIGQTVMAQQVLAPVKFQEATAQKVQLLDVRTPAEYNGGHLNQALLADWNNKKEFERRIAYLDKNKPLYVYCLGGGRSHAAAEYLTSKGFTDIKELQGGINNWKAAGLPLEAVKDVPQITMEEFQKSVAGTQTVLVDFGAEWCPPCKKMEPELAKLLATEGGKYKLVKVDGGTQTSIMQQLNVTVLPTFILFKDGKEYWRKDGFMPAEEIAKAIKQ
jgi:thioredoxin